MKGFSIHIGVNKVDQNHYKGLSDLRAAVFDAQDMLEISKRLGYSNLAILTDQYATTSHVNKAIEKAGDLCNEGDILLITFSGHGGLLEEIWGLKTPDEQYDQTWCLFDRQLIDDEIKWAFSKIKKKIRILVVSDSCHSGTVVRAFEEIHEDSISTLKIDDDFTSISKYCLENNLIEKKVPKSKAEEIQGYNLDKYKQIYQNIPAIKEDEVIPSILLFAACQDNEVTFDGLRNGRFTNALKYVLNNIPIESPQQIINSIRNYYNYPMPRTDDYGMPSAFRRIGNPFNIIRNDGDSSNGDNLILLPEQPQHPQSSTIIKHEDNSLILYSNTVKITFGLIEKLYPYEIDNISKISDETFKIELPQETNVWNAIHTITQNINVQNLDIFVERATINGLIESNDLYSAKAPGNENDFMPQWPPFLDMQTTSRTWHLSNEHSQLLEAREFVKANLDKNAKPIRIGHIDTGWDPYHPLLELNFNIRVDLARSFVHGEENTNTLAMDYLKKGNEQQGHGTGTLGLISGGDLIINGVSHGMLGCAYFLEVVPIRVTDTVVILNTESIVRGINYAIDIQCDVITMSLGGKPSIKMAKAINRAYDNGVIIVSAAGNCIVDGLGQIGPKKLVYPAFYDRVIAACGVAFNQLPYDFKAQKSQMNLKGLNVQFMQGNWGPKSAMKTAMAAYTPNVPWLITATDKLFVQSGGGTSSATPQVAAAAALWLAYYQKELNEKNLVGWEKVEMVRHALFKSANKSQPNSEKYYGNGILKAKDALSLSPKAIQGISQSKVARSSPFGMLETINLLFNRTRSGIKISDMEKEMLALELIHILDDINIEELNELLDTEAITEENLDVLVCYNKVILSQNPSKSLALLLGL